MNKNLDSHIFGAVPGTELETIVGGAGKAGTTGFVAPLGVDQDIHGMFEGAKIQNVKFPQAGFSYSHPIWGTWTWRWW